MSVLFCHNCNSEIHREPGVRGAKKYCSTACRRGAAEVRRKAKPAPDVVSICPKCGDEFTQDRRPGRSRKYCGPKCRKEIDYERRYNENRSQCSVDGCNNHSRSYRSGVCEMHYGRLRRYGALEPDGCPMCGEASRQKRNGRFCSRDCRLVAERYAQHGLTIEEGKEFEKSRGGRCDICGETPERVLCFDHCHSTGEPRGLLCSNCNTGIGFLRDDPKILQSAIEYLS